MTRLTRIRSSFVAAWHAFVRRRVAVFFTFFFPAILILIFGALVQTGGPDGAGGTGLFSEPTGYYVPGYLAVVVMFTPLTRLGTEVARHRDGNRFEKLATTPLKRWEWLLAQVLVNVALVGIAAAIVLALAVPIAGDTLRLSPGLLLVIPAGTTLFCGFGALLGRLADSQDGAVTAANAVGLPLLFLSDTFITPELLPDWFEPFQLLSPLTYFSRASRELVYQPPVEASLPVDAPFGAATGPMLILGLLAVASFVAGAYAIPTTD